ncbi:MAG: sulfatase, partial [Verrucomicrobia bacterium]|nr:sulfatase [Verrucomicrobiota bacterium]
FLIRGEATVQNNKAALLQSLNDDSPYVRAVVGEALGRFTEGHIDAILKTLVGASNMAEDGVFPAMYNLNALQMLGDKAIPIRDQIKALPSKSPKSLGRFGGYVPRLLEKLNEDLSQ